MGEGIVLHQPDIGVNYVVKRLQSQDVVLMCGCKDVHTCHRRDVAELVQADCGCAVVHLDVAAVRDLARGMSDDGDEDTSSPKQLGLWR